MSEPVVVPADVGEWLGWGADAPRRGAVTWRTLIDSRSTPTDSLSMGLARLAPGQALERHSHEQSEAYFVLEGSVTVSIGECAPRRTGPGTTVFVPGGIAHGCSNEGAEEARFLFVFAADSAADVEYEFTTP